MLRNQVPINLVEVNILGVGGLGISINSTVGVFASERFSGDGVDGLIDEILIIPHIS